MGGIACSPIFTLSSNTQLFNLALNRSERLTGHAKVKQLCFNELIQVLDRLRLPNNDLISVSIE